MNDFDFASPVVAREELEDCWRRRLEEAQARYQFATKKYHKLREESNGLPTENSALLLSLREQTEALTEVRRILRIFTQLTVYGRSPEEESTVSANGAAQ